MEELKDVTLHVYQLEAPEGSQGGASFFSRMLPSVGMGAYHTSLEVDGYRYTFAANIGIVKTKSENEGIPPGATEIAPIDLGSCECRNRGEINSIIKILGEKFFHKNSYHLVYRNCNHFSETLATSLILHDKLIDINKTTVEGTRLLQTYPEWINRLANTSKMMVGHDDDIIPCNVIQEARKAVGADEKIGWEFNNSNNNDDTRKKTSSSSSKKQGKKELTEAQKKALAKLRSGKK